MPGKADLVIQRSFLAGGGSMGALMRGHDWSASPLGPPEAWPQSLRSVVGLLINSKFPMFVAWGDELGFLYNDPYAEILGAKHPQALGQRFRQIWSEIWDDISPLVEAALAGEATYHRNLPLVMRRRGFDEETWFTFSYSPVRDESGRVAGMFCACTETTAEVMAARRRDALLELDGRLRNVADTADLSFAASELLGEALGVCRVGYGAVDHVAGTITIERNWFAPGSSDVAGLHRFADYGSYIDELLQGRAVANVDVELDPRTIAKADAFRILGIRAHLDVPVVENGRHVALLFVHSLAPRIWTDEEIAFVRDFAERTHAAVARRGAEQELRESEARLRTLTNALPAFVWFATPDGEVHYLNDRWYEYTGQTLEEALQGGWVATVHPDDASRTAAFWADARARGVTYEIELRYRRHDGAYRWYFARAEPMRGAGGEIEGWFGTSTDIHARKTAEERLRELNDGLGQQVAERTVDRDRMWRLSTDLMLVARFDAVITAVNPAWTTLLGWSEEELRGRRFIDLVHPEDVAATLAEAGLLAEGLTTLRFENRYQHKDGSYRHLSWTAVPGENLIHAVARDVTAERERQIELAAAQEQLRQAQKMEAVGQLTGGVAHDFNNLLTIIKSSTDLLRRPDLAEERRRRYVDAISDTVDRASRLTGQLLAFARRQALKPEVFDAAERIRSVIDMLRTIVGSRIQIETEIACEGCHVEADASQFETALVNMAVNARRHGRRGHAHDQGRGFGGDA